MRSHLLAFAFCLLTLSCGLLGQDQPAGGFPPPGSETLARIESFFDDARFAHAHWGVLIQSLDSGAVLVERNADRLFMPASNQKLLTGAGALLALGPDFRFRTEFRITGPVREGVLQGDLVAIGDGDPSLYTRFHQDPREVFRAVAAKLKTAGIRTITGRVVGNDDAFDDQHHGHGRTLENLPHYYAAEVGALQFNENYVDLLITPPSTPGSTVKVNPRLSSRYFQIENHLMAVASGRNQVSVDREPGSNRIVLRGQVKAGTEPFEQAPSLTNPTLFYATVLAEVLEEEGIRLEGGPVDGDDLEGGPPSTGELVHQHLSPPLSELLVVFLKRSQNLYGETLVRAMGLRRHGHGTFAAGREVVQETLASLGIPASDYAFLDGSGLSRYSLVSPRSLVRLLVALREHQHWPVWRDALPVAGRDGTLRHRMRGTAAEGRVVAKTGTVSNVRGLSGYATTRDGEVFVFSFLVNGHLRTNRETEEVTDGALAVLTDLDRR